MKDIKDMLFSLCTCCTAGKVREASDVAAEEMRKYCETVVKSENNMSFYGVLKGKKDYTLMLDAHIDEVSFVVTDIDENGFLTVSNAGGIDIRTLPSKCVLIHGKERTKGVFISTPPHLSSGETEYDDISAVKIDTCLGAKAKDLISLGDIVTYDVEPKQLIDTRVTGKSLDDRAGVTVLLELAKRLKDKELPINVVFSVVDGEELGMRGAQVATFGISPDEAVAIDVSFAVAPDVSAEEGGYISKGGMIGVSPILDREITNKLNTIAFDKKINYQNEVMGGKTGTDSDVISLSAKGVRTGLVSIPLRNMHTDCEIIDLADIKSTCDILEEYILSGGIMNV
ncbi:MAG: M28 family peptidase [Clostridia bacterium]|nr:M28 family peptidase [Clostridia bacterium]